MFNEQFFEAYLEQAPLPLALERTQECLLLAQQNFQRPILDIGCGDGIFANTLFKEQIDVGIDPNPGELLCASATNKYQELIECYGDNIPKPDGSFNTIFSNSVMEHIPEIKPVLKEAHRLLSEKGKVYLTLPTHLFDRYTWLYQLLHKTGLEKWALRYTQFFNRFWRHYHFYTSQGWRELFDECGFKVVSEQEYGPKRTCMINDVMAVWSLPAFFAKKTLNRWFWSGGWRKTYAHVIAKFFKRNLEHVTTEANHGGLIFFVLAKK